MVQVIRINTIQFGVLPDSMNPNTNNFFWLIQIEYKHFPSYFPLNGPSLRCFAYILAHKMDVYVNPTKEKCKTYSDMLTINMHT